MQYLSLNTFKKLVIFVFFLVPIVVYSAEIATLRQDTAIDTQKVPQLIPKIDNSDVKPHRSYPTQPPIIPHTIRNYTMNLNSNKCLSCHSRVQTEESQAPMVSVTHYTNREGQFLAEVSPRRYFCTQCHVPQYQVTPIINNEFVDMHSLALAKQRDISGK